MELFSCVIKASGKLLFSLFIINQMPDKISHLSFKRKGHEVFLNYLNDFKSQSIGV